MQGWRSLVKVAAIGVGAVAMQTAMAQEMPRLVQEQGRATLMSPARWEPRRIFVRPRRRSLKGRCRRSCCEAW
jgi:hypothetical protein